MKFAYSFFGFFLLFVLPFIFSSGALAALSGVWRKDVGVLVYRMRESTHQAIQVKNREQVTKARREIDKQLTKAFDGFDSDASGEIDEVELGTFFEMLNLAISQEDITKAMTAVDLDDNGSIDKSEFRHLISYVAPLVKQRTVVEHQRAIFEAVDEDRSGAIDARELRLASLKLGIRLDHIADGMSESELLEFSAFARVIEDLSAEKKREAAVVARDAKEGFLYATYQKLRRKDGTFSLLQFRRALAAIGIMLDKAQRAKLFEIVLPSKEPDGGKVRDEESGRRSLSFFSLGMDGSGTGDSDALVLSYHKYRTMIAAAVLHYESDYFPMSKFREAFLAIDDPGNVQGFIAVRHLGELLTLAGYPSSDETVVEIAAELDRGDGRLLFDDVADAMHRFMDVEAEQEVLARLRDKGRQLRIELSACFMRVFKVPIVVALLILISHLNMLIDVYLMAKSVSASKNST